MEVWDSVENPSTLQRQTTPPQTPMLCEACYSRLATRTNDGKYSRSCFRSVLYGLSYLILWTLACLLMAAFALNVNHWKPLVESLVVKTLTEMAEIFRTFLG